MLSYMCTLTHLNVHTFLWGKVTNVLEQVPTSLPSLPRSLSYDWSPLHDNLGSPTLELIGTDRLSNRRFPSLSPLPHSKVCLCKWPLCLEGVDRLPCFKKVVAVWGAFGEGTQTCQWWWLRREEWKQEKDGTVWCQGLGMWKDPRRPREVEASDTPGSRPRTIM
jgi:hypothetical protein